MASAQRERRVATRVHGSNCGDDDVLERARFDRKCGRIEKTPPRLQLLLGDDLSAPGQARTLALFVELVDGPARTGAEQRGHVAQPTLALGGRDLL